MKIKKFTLAISPTFKNVGFLARRFMMKPGSFLLTFAKGKVYISHGGNKFSGKNEH